jgi:ribonuclease PH
MNVIMAESGEFIEVQGTAEGSLFNRQELDGMLDLASQGIAQIVELQREALASG